MSIGKIMTQEKTLHEKEEWKHPVCLLTKTCFVRGASGRCLLACPLMKRRFMRGKRGSPLLAHEKKFPEKGRAVAARSVKRRCFVGRKSKSRLRI